MRIVPLAALALAACAAQTETPGPQPQIGNSELAQQIRADQARLDAELRAPGTASAGIGQTADLGGGLTVVPVELMEDSRCAANVACVWAGRVRLRALVSGVETELTLGEARAGVVLSIVKPGPWADWPVAELGEAGPYRFGFRRPDG